MQSVGRLHNKNETGEEAGVEYDSKWAMKVHCLFHNGFAGYLISI